MTLQLEGVIAPTITPRSNSKVDLPSLSKLLDFLIDGSVDIVFILGTTGEFQHIPVDYKCDVVSHTVKHVGGRVPVIVGISAKDMDEMFVLIEESEQSGAQGLVLAPMFGEDNPLNIVRRALDMSSLPIILYNNPEIHRGQNLPVAIVERFAQHPRIIGIKDSSGNADYFAELLNLKSEDFSILQGKESDILTSLAAGADGFVAGVANIIPEVCKQLWIDRSPEMMAQVMAAKDEVRQSFPDSINGYKDKLVRLGIIESDQSFKHD